MTDRPIIPTRIIPASTPLPDRPPAPGEAPPWHSAPAPVAPPPPPTAPAPVPHYPDPPHAVEVHHVHDIVLTWAEPEPDPPLWTRAWDWLWERLVTWRMLVAVLVALAPWIGGQSPVGLWSHTVHQARTEAGITAAYIIATVAVAAAWSLDHHTGRAIPRALLVTATVGAVGVLDWWDPIQLLTGVSR
ncbi:hypothetical protein [Streptomyces sp. NPDC002564]|uniref:hypothetical protein n=1 Tax=Streptomyces sp. NPDC002564 TaxID=3364649 RepID=UPI0036CF0DE0